MTRRGILHVLAIGVLVALVAPFVVYAIPEVVGAEKSFVVLSGSMQPVMSPGDAVVVSAPGTGLGIPGVLTGIGLVDGFEPGITRGDIITFRKSSDETPTTHRVVEVLDTERGEAYRTQGDANENPDSGLVRPRQVVGEVVLVLPYVGFVVEFADTQVGFVALVILPLALLATSEFYDIVRSTTGEPDGTGPSNDGNQPTHGTPADGRATGPISASSDASPPDSVGPLRDEVLTGSNSLPSASSASPLPVSVSARDEGDAYSFSRDEFRLALVLLAPVVPYTAWVAYSVWAIWSLIASAAAILSFAFVALIYWGTEWRSDPSLDDVRVTEATPVVPARQPSDDRERVPIDSLAALLRIATDGGDWLFADETGYFVLRDEAVYVYDLSDADDSRDAVLEEPNETEGDTSTEQEREEP